jgi:putative exporter of polyketide antibiotics
LEDFGECLRFWFTPDILSMLRGQFTEDAWAELKLLYFVVLCVLLVGVQYFLIERYFFT